MVEQRISSTDCRLAYFEPWKPMPLVYHHAIVGVVKPGISEQVSVDVAEMRLQHESLLRVLRELNLRVIEVDLQGSYQTFLLLERSAISCNGVVFLPIPRTVADQNNMRKLRSVLQSECSQVVVEQVNPLAKVCGSDVLFTGLEIFVGISETTNEAGAAELAEAFPDYPVYAIKMPEGADHIKNYISVSGLATLTVGPGLLAKDIWSKMTRRASRFYNLIQVPEELAANCLFANNTLVHRAIEEIPLSFNTFIEKSRNTRRSICFTEFQKIRAGLSSVCLLTKRVI